MSNYVKSTDFASKDALVTGDPLKIVSGTEINDEYNAIQIAVNTKADINSPTLTGIPTAPNATVGTSTTQLATTNFATVAIRALYPVGTIYTNASNGTNPATLLGFGTWVAFGAGRVPVGFDSSNTNFDAAEETGGSADSIVPAHTHSITDSGHTHPLLGKRISTTDASGSYIAGDSGAAALSSGESTDRTYTKSVANNSTGITINSAGVSGTNKNLQPYITVYMWKRTA